MAQGFCKYSTGAAHRARISSFVSEEQLLIVITPIGYKLSAIVI